jgi:AGZA family xanthine/uracil permease-like MFS transporter
MRSVRLVDWDDLTEAIPAFLAIVLMPLTQSITEGITFGFISYAVLKLATGKGARVHWLVYLFSVLFIVRYFLK